MDRSVLHLDLDAFYASVEILDRPELRGMAVIVGGSERRGVVTAASYEARRFGVHSAMPMARAMRLCPHGVFLPGRMARYAEVSAGVFAIYRRFTPLVEPLSIDEAFLDVTGCEALFGAPPEVARRIKEAVRRETGLAVSAGVASNKFLAKIAWDLGKPDGLVVVARGEERRFLDPLPVSRLWGVGRVTEEALRRRGIRTIGELRGVPAEEMARSFGAHGEHLSALARGIDDRPVEPVREAKSVGNEETYERDLHDPGSMRREILALSDRVAGRMRRHGVKGRTVTLKVKYRDFVQVTRAFTLPDPTDDGGTIYRCAVELLGATEAGPRPVRLLGVSVSRLCAPEAHGAGEAMEQLALFGKTGGRPAGTQKRPDPARAERLNRAVDRIREKFGPKGILPGALPGENPGG